MSSVRIECSPEPRPERIIPRRGRFANELRLSPPVARRARRIQRTSGAEERRKRTVQKCGCGRAPVVALAGEREQIEDSAERGLRSESPRRESGKSILENLNSPAD